MPTSDYQSIMKCMFIRNKLLKKNIKVKLIIAFSGHHLGISIDIASYLLGANFIERHFTLDRTWKGTDHAASLEPRFIKLCRDRSCK